MKSEIRNPKSKILIVDDEVKLCEVIELFLIKEGFEVCLAHNGIEALEKCASFKPDVVILDIVMPEMGGIKALKKIKKDYPGIQVIMSSGSFELEPDEFCKKLGASAYIEKPIDLEGLTREINEVLAVP